MVMRGLTGRSLGLKLILTGALVALLGIPLLFVNILAWERSGRAAEVAREVGEAVGGPQSLRGPFLVLPVETPQIVTRPTAEGPVQETRLLEQRVVISPDRLELDADLDVELLRRAIYDIPTYNARVRMNGTFAAGDLSDVMPEGASPRWDRARLVFAVSDLRAFRAPVRFTIDGVPGEPSFEPGTDFDNHARNWLGISAPLELESGQAFGFEAELVFGGAQSLTFVASGRDTVVKVDGDWPHPGFSGGYLPESRELSEAGFSAQWQVPYLARGVPARWLEGERFELADADRARFSINLTDPADGYAQVSRALKYAIFFLGFTVLSVFLLEVASGARIHAAQYLMIGLGQVIFYLLMLALSEHQSVIVAYLFSAGATAALTGLYAVTAFASKAKGAVMLALMVLVYTLQYMLLILESYALLMGAWMAFAALGITMWMTRNIDWYAGGQRSRSLPDRDGGEG